MAGFGAGYALEAAENQLGNVSYDWLSTMTQRLPGAVLAAQDAG